MMFAFNTGEQIEPYSNARVPGSTCWAGFRIISWHLSFCTQETTRFSDGSVWWGKHIYNITYDVANGPESSCLTCMVCLSEAHMHIDMVVITECSV